MNWSHQTAKTQFVDADGVRFAYRRFGRCGEVPLLFNQHLLGTMDSWDPAVINGLAREREAILFDNAGVASSSGAVPVTFAEMARQAGAFLDALKVSKADVLGFSTGAMVAQMMALNRPELVRKLVLVGGAPRNGDQIPLSPEARALFEMKFASADDFWLNCFFTDSPEGRKAGSEFLHRRDARKLDRDLPASDQAGAAQFAAFEEWGKPDGPRFEYLKHIKQPVLVIHGAGDIIVHSINSVYLKKYIPNARLILYPEAAHGALFQYPELFVEQVSSFLAEK